MSDADTLTAPVAGVIWKLETAAGDALAAGQTVLLIESMKMEIPLEAPRAGCLLRLLVAEGEAVTEDQPLALLGP